MTQLSYRMIESQAGRQGGQREVGGQADRLPDCQTANTSAQNANQSLRINNIDAVNEPGSLRSTSNDLTTMLSCAP